MDCRPVYGSSLERKTMADKETNLLNALTTQRMGASVPAKVDERGEPVEVVTDREKGESGRSPEQVLGTRETRPAPTPSQDDKDARKTVAPRKWKVRDEELTLEEIAAKGLLDLMITQSSQASHYQKLYEDSEKAVAKEVAKPTETVDPQVLAAQQEKAHREATLQVIQNYEPAAKKEIEFYVANGLMEPDLPEAYQKAITSMFSILLFQLDAINANAVMNGSIKDWIAAEIGKRNAVITMSLLDQAINAVAAKADDHVDAKGEAVKGDKVFEGLKDSAVRQAFVAWLRKEVDPKVASLTAENMERFWLAFNAPALLDGVKTMIAKTTEKPSRVRAQGDGSPSRPAIKEAPKELNLLDRMTESRLGSAEA